MNGWRILWEPGKIDPAEATLQFVLVNNGEIIHREAEIRTGFIGNAEDAVREILGDQIEALQKPWIREIHETRLEGL